MNRIKCRHCDLVNLATDQACRRCGREMAQPARAKETHRGPREAARSSSSLYTLLAVCLVGGAIAYFYFGVQRSFDEVKATDANRVAAQPKQPTDGLSRRELEQQRTQQYRNAIQNSAGLAESQKRLEETQKLMQPGNSPK